MKEKIAFVVTRYGKDINGGAELHCRMLAERLSDRYDTEVLTTCVRNYVTGECGYVEGVEKTDGVTVRRFPVNPEKTLPEKKWLSRIRTSRRVRRILYRCGLLRFAASVSPIWKWGLKADINALKSSIFYSPAMIGYLSEHKSEYKAVFSITATYAPFYFTAMTAGEKMIAIPTLHPERAAFRPSLTVSFTSAALVGYNTGAEKRLAESVFGPENIRGRIIGTGIEDTPPAGWDAVREKYSLPDRYIVFIGRIEKGKAGKLIKYYLKYAAAHPDAPKLVMVGGIIREVGRHEGIIYTGFVSDEEKRAILQHAILLVNPSKYESLSLVVLEALRDRVPVLVNGKCNVLKEHSILSGNAVRAYCSYRDFRRELDDILHNPQTVEEMKTGGEKYFKANYDWDIIMPRLYEAIESVSEQWKRTI